MHQMAIFTIIGVFLTTKQSKAVISWDEVPALEGAGGMSVEQFQAQATAVGTAKAIVGLKQDNHSPELATFFYESHDHLVESLQDDGSPSFLNDYDDFRSPETSSAAHILVSFLCAAHFDLLLAETYEEEGEEDAEWHAAKNAIDTVSSIAAWHAAGAAIRTVIDSILPKIEEEKNAALEESNFTLAALGNFASVNQLQTSIEIVHTAFLDIYLNAWQKEYFKEKHRLAYEAALPHVAFNIDLEEIKAVLAAHIWENEDLANNQYLSRFSSENFPTE